MGSTKISAPATPAAPTTAQNMQDYVANLPALYNAQLQYSPLFNQQDYEQTATYAPLLKGIQDAMYPNTSALPEQLASQASAGGQNGMPQYMKDMYADQMRAELGNQAGSGIGADYVSKGMVAQNEAYKQYYNNLGLSVAGLQPLSQSSQYQQAYNPSSTYTYGQVANNNMQGYGSYSSAFSGMQSAAMGARATLGASKNAMYGQMAGGAMGGLGTWMAG